MPCQLETKLEDEVEARKAALEAAEASIASLKADLAAQTKVNADIAGKTGEQTFDACANCGV